MRSISQIDEILICPERRVYLHVVPCIIAVIRTCFEDRIEIDHRDAKRFQVVQPVPDTAKASSVDRPFDDSLCRVTYIVSRTVPVHFNCALHIYAAFINSFIGFFAAVEPFLVTLEPVREYLIDYAVLEPLRSLRLIVYSDLIRNQLALINCSAQPSATVAVIAVVHGVDAVLVLQYQLEAVPEETAVLRGFDDCRKPVQYTIRVSAGSVLISAIDDSICAGSDLICAVNVLISAIDWCLSHVHRIICRIFVTLVLEYRFYDIRIIDIDREPDFGSGLCCSERGAIL